MKAKNLWLVLLITLAFCGCNDNTGGLGIGMLPGSDGITVGTKKFDVITEDSLAGAVYAKTNVGYVGRFTDNQYGFGYYEGSFLTELNCVDDLTFPQPYDPVTNRDSIYNMAGTIDEAFYGAYITLGYYSFFGDSLNPMQVSIYEVEKELEKNPYTDITPDTYTPNKKLLGRKSFSAVDLTDSLRTATGYLNTVIIPVPDELGKRIITENHANPGTFKNSETFKKFFKGIYITSEAGEGTVLYLNYVDLEIVFKGYQLDSVGNIKKKYNPETGEYNGADSTNLYSRSFASTMEVIQTNNIYVSEEILKEKVAESGQTYLKAPAGIYTRAILPIGKIMDKNNGGIDMDQDTINSVKLVFNAYRQEEATNEYSMSPPTTVLLIREKEVEEFFTKNMLPNSTTSYYTTYSNNRYTFTNIMRLVTTMAEELEKAKEEEVGTWNADKEKAWLNENAVAIIPVTLGITTSSSGATTITNVRHDLKPTYVKLKEGSESDPIQLEVVYSRFSQ